MLVTNQHCLCSTLSSTLIHASKLYTSPRRFIFQCDIIQGTPPALRKKAARLVGAKTTLLARMDAYGQVGRNLA